MTPWCSRRRGCAISWPRSVPTGMIGTDYPYPWTSTSVEHVLDSLHLSDAQKAVILGGTAATPLGIASAWVRCPIVGLPGGLKILADDATSDRFLIRSPASRHGGR